MTLKGFFKPRKGKTGTLYIRVIKDRVSSFVSLKEVIKESEWNPKKFEVRTSCPDYERLNQLISDKINELKKLHQGNTDPKKIATNNKKSFLGYLLSEVEHLEGRGKIGTSKRYRTAYYHLKKFNEPRTDLLFSEMDSTFIRNFESHLLKNGNKNNTVKNYIKCVKRLWVQATKMNIYTHIGTDPFILFVNKRDEVEKKRLTKKEVEKVKNLDLGKDHLLFNTRNYFLFQIMSQGLRVSDLMTLRWSNLNREQGRIDFLQFKTKTAHSILINEQMVFILMNYVDYDFRKILSQKFKIKKDKKYTGESYTLAEMRVKYVEIQKETIHSVITQDKAALELVAFYNKLLLDIQLKISSQILLVILDWSKKHPNDFIFPILNSEDFADVKFIKEIYLSKYQYNQLQSKTTYYNKNLKKLQKLAGIETTLTSHLQRHTFTNILLENTNDVYVISKTLGHKKLNTTEQYMSNFIKDKVDEPIINLSNMFSVV